MKSLMAIFLTSSVFFTASLSCLAAASTISVKKALAQESAILEKTPRSIFLVKRAKINSDVNGPRFDPAEAQLRTVTDDEALHNFKKFE